MTLSKDIIAEGDKVWVHARVTGTHTGEWRIVLPHINKEMRLTPTGKKITFTYVDIYRIVYDLMNLYQQLGVIECKEFPKDVS